MPRVQTQRFYCHDPHQRGKKVCTEISSFYLKKVHQICIYLLSFHHILPSVCTCNSVLQQHRNTEDDYGMSEREFNMSAAYCKTFFCNFSLPIQLCQELDFAEEKEELRMSNPKKANY